MSVFAHWPNRITALRFLLATALFGILAVWVGSPPAEHRGVWCVAFWLFVITASTDFLDGYLARRDNLVSAFGRIADPFVDKVLILGAMIFLIGMPESLLPAWMVVVILSREFLVTGIRGYVESAGGEFPADGFGKIKMIVQCFAVGGLMWIEAYDWGDWREFWRIVVVVLVWATLLATVGSGLTYVLKTRSALEGSRR